MLLFEASVRSKAGSCVFIVCCFSHYVFFCVESLFCCVALGALSSLLVILPRNREMVA